MRTLATLLLAFVLAPAFAQTPCDGADHTILAGNYYYNPASLTINAGETVAWVNEDGFHDVNGDISVLTGTSFGNPEAFSLPSVSGNAMGVCMGAHTFTVPGTYEYDCSIGSHAQNGMVASITVIASSSGCNDPLACNYDEDGTGTDDCDYFDTELFTLEENDFIGLIDFEDCANGYPGAYSLPVPLGQDPAGGPLFFTLFEDVESFLVEFGFEIAAQDLSTVTMSVCDTVLNYNSLVLGDTDMFWDGTGFPNEFYGSFVVPESSLPIGCADEEACNFDPCVHPFVEEGCEYLDIGTLDGDTLVEAGGTLTFTATPGAGNGFEWYSDCAVLDDDNEVATITVTEDCEVCFIEYNSDSCSAEVCFNLSVLSSVDERGQFPWQFMPNPAADALRVVWGGEAAVFEVFDLNGRRVHTATVYRGVTTLDLSALQPGLYLAGPQGSELQRLAIQR